MKIFKIILAAIAALITGIFLANSGNIPLVLVGMALIPTSIIGMSVLIWRSAKAEGEEIKTRMLATKALYEKSLYELQEDSTNSTKHQEALTHGREYYSFLHPNTYDMNQNGISSNFRDNAGIVEAKVQSDIQARIGKGKVS